MSSPLVTLNEHQIEGQIKSLPQTEHQEYTSLVPTTSTCTCVSLLYCTFAMWSYHAFLPSLKPPSDLNLRLTDTKEGINKNMYMYMNMWSSRQTKPHQTHYTYTITSCIKEICGADVLEVLLTSFSVTPS